MEHKIVKGRNYLLACSFSAESMALLDWLLNRGCLPVVLFIDYQNTPSAAEDLAGVKQYCAEKGLVVEVCNAIETPIEEGESYHDWARRVRYAFFAEMYAKYDAAALFVAHIQDDLLETYLLQKQSGGKVEHYGLNEVNTYRGMIVVRPLLPYTYDDVLETLQEHNVPYSQEMAKFEREHTRSDIRRERIDKMDEAERGQLMDEIMAANNEKISYFAHVSEKAGEESELGIREIIALDEDEFTETLTAFVNQGKEAIALTPRKIAQIRAMCLNGKLFDSISLGKETYVIKEYDLLALGSDPESLPYSYTLEKPGKLSAKEFDLDFTGGASDRGIKDSDYPLTIRTALPADQTVYGDFTYFVRSLYHDWKMPSATIARWPVFVNKRGQVVHVPAYGKEYAHAYSSYLDIHINEKAPGDNAD